MIFKSNKNKRNLTVLLLDDNPQIKASFRQFFKKVFPSSLMVDCSTESDLLTILSTQQFDLLILDSRLYGKSALELIRNLKSKYPQLRIIGLYTNTSDPFKDLLINAGADGYISKFEVRPRIVKKQIKKALL